MHMGMRTHMHMHLHAAPPHMLHPLSMPHPHTCYTPLGLLTASERQLLVNTMCIVAPGTADPSAAADPKKARAPSWPLTPNPRPLTTNI